tara:strand:- start:5919 stop:6362 length:444 start_codon:yes stop_codon:yes gene_type:complete
MQAIAQKVAMQAALIGSVSMGSYILRKIKTNDDNPYISNTNYLKTYPDLCIALNGIFLLRNDKIFSEIVTLLESILEMINLKNPEVPWKINRMMKNVLDLVNLMKTKAVRSFDDDLLTFAIDFEKEYYPLLQGQLDNILHNMLLDRC